MGRVSFLWYRYSGVPVRPLVGPPDVVKTSIVPSLAGVLGQIDFAVTIP